MYFAFCNCVTICTKSNKSTFGLWRPGEGVWTRDKLPRNCTSAALAPKLASPYNQSCVLVFACSCTFCIFVPLYFRTLPRAYRGAAIAAQKVPLATNLSSQNFARSQSIRTQDWDKRLNIFTIFFFAGIWDQSWVHRSSGAVVVCGVFALSNFERETIKKDKKVELTQYLLVWVVVLNLNKLGQL